MNMKKFFSKAFNIKTTYVKFYGPTPGLYHKISAINDTRVNIQVENLSGSFQRGHIAQFTNIEPLEIEKY